MGADVQIQFGRNGKKKRRLANACNYHEENCSEQMPGAVEKDSRQRTRGATDEPQLEHLKIVRCYRFVVIFSTRRSLSISILPRRWRTV